MRTALICHTDAHLNNEVLIRWLGSWSIPVAVVCIQNTYKDTLGRFRRELKRVGSLRILDVLAFRIYYLMCLKRRDIIQENILIENLKKKYSPLSNSVPSIITNNVNSKKVEMFLKSQKPDIMIARCKMLLKKRIFEVPKSGTFILHPGICPEYRNSHGCFWAIVNGDADRVGSTLLRIDEGVDTGEIFDYFYVNFDETQESHILIQYRTVFENLTKISCTLKNIYYGKVQPIDTTGRDSKIWGQPWLTSYFRRLFYIKRHNI